jgi:PKD repeat protein
MKQLIFRSGVVFAFVAVVAACTMKKQETPSLTGPSEFGKSINITVSPDAITQDGISQSVVVVTALGVNGQPLPNVSMRAEIRVDNIVTDFGKLSARSLATNSAGTATVVYTAPTTPIGQATDPQTVVQIGITPLETDFGNAATRFASIRLLPPGTVQPPSDLPLAFDTDGTTTSTTIDETASFKVRPPAGVTIVRYSWDFGDGSTTTTTVPSTTHGYRSPGSFLVSVTAEDTIGRTGRASTNIAVAGPAVPEADFVVSPTNPTPNETVRFNASTTMPSPGRTIVRYDWDFGNGERGTGQTITTTYPELRSYTVVLTVTDDRGRTDTAAKTVTVVKPPQ